MAVAWMGTARRAISMVDSGRIVYRTGGKRFGSRAKLSLKTLMKMAICLEWLRTVEDAVASSQQQGIRIDSLPLIGSHTLIYADSSPITLFKFVFCTRLEQGK